MTQKQFNRVIEKFDKYFQSTMLIKAYVTCFQQLVQWPAEPYYSCQKSFSTLCGIPKVRRSERTNLGCSKRSEPQGETLGVRPYGRRTNQKYILYDQAQETKKIVSMEAAVNVARQQIHRRSRRRARGRRARRHDYSRSQVRQVQGHSQLFKVKDVWKVKVVHISKR